MSFAKDITIGTVAVSQRGYVGQDGAILGSSVEITNRVVELAGYTPINKLMPFPRVLHNLESGTVDLSLLVPNDKVTQFATPLIHLQDVEFILVSRNDTEITNIEDIKGKSVGYLRSSRISQNILKPLDVNRIELDKYPHMIRMLEHGRIDAIIGTTYNIKYALQELNYSDDTFAKPLLIKSLELHLVYSKKTADEEVIDALINAANTLKEEGIIQDIIDKYSHSSIK